MVCQHDLIAAAGVAGANGRCWSEETLSGARMRAVTADTRSAPLSGGLTPRRLLHNVGVSDSRGSPRSVPP
jgi:hypothetical protein